MALNTALVLLFLVLATLILISPSILLALGLAAVIQRGRKLFDDPLMRLTPEDPWYLFERRVGSWRPIVLIGIWILWSAALAFALNFAPLGIFSGIGPWWITLLHYAISACLVWFCTTFWSPRCRTKMRLVVLALMSSLFIQLAAIATIAWMLAHMSFMDFWKVATFFGFLAALGLALLYWTRARDNPTTWFRLRRED